MATTAQILANQANAQYSTGATTESGKQTSSKNRTTHGLCYRSGAFVLTPDEDPEKYAQLVAALFDEYQPATITENLLVTRMAQHEWLRERAQFLQAGTFSHETGKVADTKAFALYLRYETTNERAFDKARRELQNIRAERRKVEIGFESQKLKQAADLRADESLNLRKQTFEWQKEVFEIRQNRSQGENEVKKASGTGPQTALRSHSAAA